MSEYSGHYYFMGLLFEVREEGGMLVAGMPGVPPGYEVRLKDLGDDRFRMSGGPVDGSTAGFVRGNDGEIRAIRTGRIELAKISPDKLETLYVVERLLAPALDLTPEKKSAFEPLLEKVDGAAFDGPIDYTLPFPKHEFIRYLMDLDRFIFHGSGAMDIDEFKPERKSVELYDRSGIGNLPAVYGTHDGLWAMFFAIVDRERLDGSIRNGVIYMHDAAGKRLAVYNFSVNQDQLADRPWRAGALYILPRESFQRQWLTEESPANEWASYEPVRPLAMLPVDPEDFPFLDRIGGHDDGILVRAQELAREVRAAAKSATLEGDMLQVTFPASEEIGAKLEDLVEIQQTLMPAAMFKIEADGGSLILTVRSLPPAYQHVYRQTYADLLG